jgi:hypothetical protein
MHFNVGGMIPRYRSRFGTLLERGELSLLFTLAMAKQTL